MNKASPGTEVPAAVRCAARRAADPEGDRRLRADLDARQGWRAEYFLPKDDDEMNTALAAGRFRHAAFLNLDALWEAVWKGEADLDAWEAAGVEIHVVEPPAADRDAWRGCVRETYRSLKKWRTANRRRQIVAAVVLSLLALAAMAALLSITPPVR